MSGQVVFLCLVIIGIQCLCINAGSCPQPYARYSKTHTYCKDKNPSCQNLASGVSEADKKVILKEHNKYRNKVAMGEESIGPLPTASDMLQMEWDDEIAQIAQKHADQCKFVHDCNECRQTKNYGVGQNIYNMGSMGETTPVWPDAIKSWYDEVSNFNKDTISSFDANSGTGVIGHFTQEIWAKTWKVGCGYTVYKEGNDIKKFHVCNYGPAGNMKSDPIYTQGKTCSACPKNSCCGDSCQTAEYPGLCKITDGKAPQYEKKFKGALWFFCNFNETSNCPVKKTQGDWKESTTLSDSYIGIVVKAGQTGIFNITTEFKTTEPACFSARYRKGPNVDGQTSANTAIEQYRVTKSGNDFDVNLKSDSTIFQTHNMNLGWDGYDYRFFIAIVFSAKKDSSDQYFEITDMTFTKGKC